MQSNPDLAGNLFPYLLETYEYCGSPSQFLILDIGGSDGSLMRNLQPFIAQEGLSWKTQIYDVSSGDVRRIPIREQFGVVIAHKLLGESISHSELDWLEKWWPQTSPMLAASSE